MQGGAQTEDVDGKEEDGNEEDADRESFGDSDPDEPEDWEETTQKDLGTMQTERVENTLTLLEDSNKDICN